ncbi:FAD/NAD(P)-binding protein [Ulvibacter litoralis]|uniref:FAD-NAD(P)-binding n=1 Tax=Ulvibacter litoralis TaxID=227084 RepID=A0A1G7C9K5_9FLAO|nr:FAD/NAD(P)-binding protein [Ulvibacter litoralis]GHC48124.1 FAD-dependent oxidoreductase [Ulvibacter litoralis]SDE35999.1 FAD-NAD(P)-binding [Ulvibacter litoralis]
MIKTSPTTSEKFKIAIVGFGPKGLYGFERLVSQIHHSKCLSEIEIHLFNRTPFLGAGDVYRNDQPDYLLMNYPDHKIDFNISEDPKMICPIESFEDWKRNGSTSQPKPTKNNYSSRATVGEYLTHCFATLCNALDENCTVIPHVDTVVDVTKTEETYHLKTEKEGWNPHLSFQTILFTTGHYWFRPATLTSNQKDAYINFIYPVSDTLKKITSSSSVIVKGFGLTFIDAVLALSEGKGGIFKTQKDGKLTYIASGKEPNQIAVFSRSGLPMIPRDGASDENLPLRYITPSFVDDLLNAKHVDFEEHILPFILKEFYVAYYTKLFLSKKVLLQCSTDFLSIRNQVESFHRLYESKRFHWKAIENYFHSNPLLTTEMVVAKIREDIDAVEKNHAITAVYSCWPKISGEFNKIYSAGILTAESKNKFDTYYFGLFNRISYGPPLRNMKKVLALSEAGLLNFNYVKNAQLEFDESSEKYSLTTELNRSEFDFLINATIPRGNDKKNRSLLFENLLSRGLLSENTAETSEDSTPIIHLTQTGNAITAEGDIAPTITFYGTPTEGNTFDNDTLSRTRNNNASTWAENVMNAVLTFQKLTLKL